MSKKSNEARVKPKHATYKRRSSMELPTLLWKWKNNRKDSLLTSDFFTKVSFVFPLAFCPYLQIVQQLQTAVPKSNNLLPINRCCLNMALSARVLCKDQWYKILLAFAAQIPRAWPPRTGKAASPNWERHN